MVAILHVQQIGPILHLWIQIRCSLLTLQFHLKKKTFFLQTNEKSYVKPPIGRYIDVTLLTIDNTVSEYAIRILHCIFGMIFHYKLRQFVREMKYIPFGA